MIAPKVFISYSWTTAAFQNQIRLWAERLISDGVNVLLDQFDLKEGQDKYHYMEKMVTDSDVTHVLMFCDERYAQKANKREAGVGTESQIISKGIYDKVAQSKFIPIVCEFSADGQPCIPVFAQSRIWVDFSSEEAANKNWERLIRHLYGKPLYEKPQAGKPPAYILESSSNSPANPAAGKFSVFKNAYLAKQKGLRSYRADFLDACCAFVDGLRPRARVEIKRDEIPQWIVESHRKLIPIRDAVADWILLEGNDPSEDFEAALLSFLERLLELWHRPEGVSSWNDWWYEPHQLFAYETFLYIVAALLRVSGYSALHTILISSYLRPPQSSGSAEFVTKMGFYFHTEHINAALTTEKFTYHSQAMELISRCATRQDITFSSIREADVLIHLSSYLNEAEDPWWYPQSHYYSGFHARPQFFTRASQHRNFKNLAVILGVSSGDELRAAFAARREREKSNPWRRGSFENLINLEKLDTIN